MNTNQWKYYCQLEQMSEYPRPHYIRPTLDEWIDRILQFLIATSQEVYEPKIWCTQDRFGEIWWHVYQARTDEVIHFSSEQEVLAWLDECSSFRY
uniref:Uncharacterized protein n=1 Tax=Oscillatoriales cyanobacterium SpSt-402 TaxID=2282168 RepID=A0A832H0Z4_9CYAN